MKFIFLSLSAALFFSACAGSVSEDDYCAYRNAKNLYMKGSESEALLILEKLEREKPSFVLPYILDGRISLIAGDAERAEEKLTFAFNKNPSDYETLRRLGELYLRKGEFEKAEAVFVSALEKFPGDARFLILLGQAERKLEKYGEALQAYDRAFLFEEELGYAHLDTALIYGAFGMSERYTAELERAVSVAGEEGNLRRVLLPLIRKEEEDG